MWKTVLRRVLIMIPEIIILSVFVFILAKMMPGDPFTGSITPQTSPARIHELKVQAGLYDPWYVQYGWLDYALFPACVWPVYGNLHAKCSTEFLR